MQVEDVGNKLSELSETAQVSLESGQAQLSAADAWLRQLVREHPTATLFCFLSVGYAVGRWVAKR